MGTYHHGDSFFDDINDKKSLRKSVFHREIENSLFCFTGNMRLLFTMETGQEENKGGEKSCE